MKRYNIGQNNYYYRKQILSAGRCYFQKSKAPTTGDVIRLRKLTEIESTSRRMLSSADRVGNRQVVTYFWFAYSSGIKIQY